MGPYVHIGMSVQGPGSVATPNARGAQVFIGNASEKTSESPVSLVLPLEPACRRRQLSEYPNLQNAHQRPQPMTRLRTCAKQRRELAAPTELLSPGVDWFNAKESSSV